MRLHKVKLQQPFFDDVWNGDKDFEVRFNDRDYQVGDRLMLLEVRDAGRSRYVLKDIKYVLQGGQYGVEQGYVVLGLKNIIE